LASTPFADSGTTCVGGSFAELLLAAAGAAAASPPPAAACAAFISSGITHLLCFVILLWK
jgi:hypothetical protein